MKRGNLFFAILFSLVFLFSFVSSSTSTVISEFDVGVNSKIDTYDPSLSPLKGTTSYLVLAFLGELTLVLLVILILKKFFYERYYLKKNSKKKKAVRKKTKKRKK